MQHFPDSLVSSSLSRPGYLAEVTQALIHICDSNASGRLSIRNSEQFGLAHLYFKRARLVHVTGDKRDGDEVLSDILSWSKGNLRFDSEAVIDYEDLTWQQAQIFGRWLSFLEMRGQVQGTKVNGLTHRLMAPLPQQPVALPEEVEHYEEYEATVAARQWHRVSESVNQFIDRTLPQERRQQIQRVSKSAAVRVFAFLRQTGRLTKKLAQQLLTLVKLWEKWATPIVLRMAKQALEQAMSLGKRTAGRIVSRSHHAEQQERVEEIVSDKGPPEQRQLLVQTAQNTVQSIGETVSHTASQIVSVPPTIRSIRPVRPVTASLPTLGDE